MNTLSTVELKSLVEEHDGPFVTISMPTQRAGLETRQNPIRFRKLTRDAEEKLAMNGMRPPDAVLFMQPARKLLDDALFWQHQEAGLVVFISPRTVRHFRLPAPPEENVIVGERFNIRPILRILTSEHRHYILTLSQNKVKLFKASENGIRELTLKDTPNSLDVALQNEHPEKQLQFRTAPGGKGGRGSATYYGQGAASDINKERLLRYVRMVESGISKQIINERAPLVFAGVDYIHAMYKDVNTYPHLIEQPITGNVEDMGTDELRKRAWELVQPLFDQEQQSAVARFRQASATPRVSRNVSQVAVAAYHGRVDVLFVQNGAQRWGAFAPEVDAVHEYDAQQPGSEDMLDFAAVHTLLNGGMVYAVDQPHMPNGSVIAAILRY